MNECLILFQPSEFKFSLKFDDQLLTSHNPAYENTLKVLMKESAEFCDIDALVQVIEQPWQSKGHFGPEKTEKMAYQIKTTWK